MKFHALAGALMLGLSACQTAPSGSDAVSLYGVAKGMGEVVLGVAETADPGIAQAVAGIKQIIASADPLVSAAQTDATAAAKLASQANALTLAAAPLISVVANAAKAE